jgi:hypothetical protein
VVRIHSPRPNISITSSLDKPHKHPKLWCVCDQNHLHEPDDLATTILHLLEKDGFLRNILVRPSGFAPAGWASNVGGDESLFLGAQRF